MSKGVKVSDKAKKHLYKQQLQLLDNIEDATKDNDAVWVSYFESIVPMYWVGEKAEIRAAENLSIRYMELFRDCVYAGATPSAPILFGIAEYFDRYLKDSSGKLLDEAFKLRHKPKSGNPIQQNKRQHRLAAINIAMWLQRKLHELRGKKISIEAAAGIVINKWNLPDSDESLKKQYIKYGVDEMHKDGYYPKTQEVIKDLERAFDDATQMYAAGAIGTDKKSPEVRKRVKDGLKDVVASCIERLGNN